MRVAVGQLPPGTTHALAVALRPSPRGRARPAQQPATEMAAAALRMAAGWLPQGTPKAAALAVARGGGPRRSPACQRSRPTAALEALVVAAQHQPQAWELAAAAGRSLLEARRTSAVAGALGLAAKQMSPEVTAALRLVTAQVKRATCGQRRRWIRSCRESNQQDSECRTRRHPLGLPSLCHDTSGRVIETLWPPRPQVKSIRSGEASASELVAIVGCQGLAQLSPRTCESRLRHSAPFLQDLQQVSAVSPLWARRADQEGWPAAHAYLYQELGTKGELRQRYQDSMGRLLVKDWMQRPGRLPPGSEGLVNRIFAFMP